MASLQRSINDLSTLGFSLATTKDFFCFNDVDHLFATMGKVMLGAIIAFFMELTEYLLVSYTSSLTLSVSGIVKVKKSHIYDFIECY